MAPRQTTRRGNTRAEAETVTSADVANAAPESFRAETARGAQADLFERLRSKGAHDVGSARGEREKIALEREGEYFIARLVKVMDSAKPNDRTGKHFKIYHFDDVDGNGVYFLGSFDFDDRMADGKLIGHVVAVALVEHLDTGKPNAIKIYDILDLGEVFPPEAEGLPF